MKKRLLIQIAMSAIVCAVICNNNAFAVSYEDVKSACSNWGVSPYINTSGVSCSAIHSAMSSSDCGAAGGTITYGDSSSLTCSWGRVVPTSRTGAGAICAKGWGRTGSWKGSTGICVVPRASIGANVDCSLWGATSASSGSDQYHQACLWSEVAVEGSEDDGKNDDDSDDPSVIDPGEKVAPILDGDCTTGVLSSEWCNNKDGIANIVEMIVTVLTGAVVVAGTIGIIICGFLWMTARDNEAQVAKAKKRILDIVIGIVAWVLLALIANLFIPKTSEKIETDMSYNMNSSKDIKI